MSTWDEIKSRLGVEDKRPLHVIVKETETPKIEAKFDDVGLGPFHPFINKDTEIRAQFDTKMAGQGSTEKPQMSRGTFVQVFDRARKGSQDARKIIENLNSGVDYNNDDPHDLYDQFFGQGKKDK